MSNFQCPKNHYPYCIYTSISFFHQNYISKITTKNWSKQIPGIELIQFLSLLPKTQGRMPLAPAQQAHHEVLLAALGADAFSFDDEALEKEDPPTVGWDGTKVTRTWETWCRTAEVFRWFFEIVFFSKGRFLKACSSDVFRAPIVLPSSCYQTTPQDPRIGTQDSTAPSRWLTVFERVLNVSEIAWLLHIGLRGRAMILIYWLKFYRKLLNLKPCNWRDNSCALQLPSRCLEVSRLSSNTAKL